MNNKKIKEIQNNVSGSLAVEGLTASKKTIEINKKYLTGELNSSEAIESIKNYHLKGGIKNG